MVSPADFALWTVIALGVFLLGLLSFVVFVVGGVLRCVFALLGFGGRRRITAPPAPALNAPLCGGPRCGHRNRRGSRFCARCGERLGSAHN